MKFGQKRILVIAVAVVAASSIVRGAQTGTRAPFAIGGLSVAAGQAQSGFLEVPGGETKIPVTVIHGIKPGRVLAAVAGIHGAEYPPILSLLRVKDLIRPAELSGTLILVHVANLPSFQRRTVYFVPSDGKNLNRVFPGDPNGTLSQRIAHVLTTEVVDRCDALIDMHCGDSNEALIPYTYWMISPDEAVTAEAKAMSLAFGIPTIIIDDTRSQDIKDSKYLGNTALLRKKPAITTEYGFLGRSDEIAIQKNVSGILSVMRLFKMIAGAPGSVSQAVWIDKYEVVNSAQDGLFFPEVEMGQYVAAGQRIGYLTDYFGARLETLTAPFEGIVLYVIGTPPANRGEPLFEVGRVKRD